MTAAYSIDPMGSIDSFSRSAVHLTMYYERQKLATGSGVIAQLSSGCCLITARHNLSGRNSETGSPLSDHGGVPNEIEIEGGQKTKFWANLYDGDNDPNASMPLFLRHPLGETIDVTMLPVRLPGPFFMPLDRSFLIPNQNERLQLRVSQTCHIIGFPEGLAHRPRPEILLPIWKTGHIASEPNFDEPRLLIDATTRSGMSGSMVVVTEEDGNRFVGIYTGRCKQVVKGDSRSIPENDETVISTPAIVEKLIKRFLDERLTAELGWVFKSRVVAELRTGNENSPA